MIIAEACYTKATKHGENNEEVSRAQGEMFPNKWDVAKDHIRKAHHKCSEASASLANTLDYKKNKDKIKPLSFNALTLTLITSTKCKYWEKRLALP